VRSTSNTNARRRRYCRECFRLATGDVASSISTTGCHRDNRIQPESLGLKADSFFSCALNSLSPPAISCQTAAGNDWRHHRNLDCRVAAGVASLVVALAINNGFRQDLQNRLLGSTSHINLLRIESDGIKDWRPLMERLSKQPHVVATAPAIYEQVLISRGASAWAVLKGMIPASSVRLRSSEYGEDWSMDALDKDALDKGSPVNSGSSTRPGRVGDRPHTAASTPGSPESADTMNAVQERVASMPPIVLVKTLRGSGSHMNSIVMVTSPQGELTPFGLVPNTFVSA